MNVPDTQTVRWFSSLGSKFRPDIPEIWTGRNYIAQHTPAETEIIK